MAEEREPPAQDRIEIFKQATSSFMQWYGDKFADRMTDDELEAALTRSLGIFGGSGGPDRYSITFKGASLKL